MWPTLFVSFCLAGLPNDPANVAEELSARCTTGTLLFSNGDCLAVKVFSGSRFTHCAAVVVEEGKPVVYDSMNGVGVRRTSLDAYLRLQAPSEIQVVHPSRAWTEPEVQAFRGHLTSQLGRPYGIKHHVSGQRAAGVHCAEYCTDALVSAGQIEVDRAPRVSPGSLYDGLVKHALYADGGTYALAGESPPPVEAETWCRRAWRETCECTLGCCRQLSRWMLCREK